MRFSGEPPAFYRILFRHQDRVRSGIRKVGGSERVVIGKGAGRNIESEQPQQ